MGGVGMFIILGILSAIYTVFLAVFFIIVIYLLVSYVFESLALHTMSNYKTLSWVPCLNKYCLGSLVKKEKMGLVLTIVDLMMVILGSYLFLSGAYSALLFLLLLLLTAVSFVLNTILAHLIFKERSARFGDIYTILSVLSLGLLRPIFMFVLRNKHSYSAWYKN